MAFCILVTPFLADRIGEFSVGGYLIYFLFDIILLIAVTGSVSIAESRDERAVAYLCLMPIRREWYVLEKYVLDLILIGSYALIYFLETEAGLVAKLKIGFCLLLTFIALLYRCIYIPIEIKFGYEKTKFITTIVGLMLPFGLPVLLEKADLNELYTDIKRLNGIGMCFVILVFIAAEILVSYLIARKIFIGKDL